MKHIHVFILLFSALISNTVFAQQRASYSVSAGYTMVASGSHDAPNISTAFPKGAYIRYSFEYDKMLSPFMFISYHRKHDDAVGNTTPQLWNIVAGATIRGRKNWPLYNTLYAGIENAKLNLAYETYSLRESNKSAVIGGELGLKYPMNSFIAGDLAVGLRLPFNDKGLATGWRLGVIFDFSKR